MAGDAGAAAIGILIQNLVNISKEEISLIRGLEKNGKKLRGTFSMIQRYLDDAQKKFISSDAVKEWLMKLENEAFEADNVLDELNYHILSNQRRRMDIEAKEEEEKKAASCFPSCCKHYPHRRRMALRIKEINTNFESIRKEAEGLGLQKMLAEAPAADTASTDSFTVDPIFIGRDKDVSEIVEMLTAQTHCWYGWAGEDYSGSQNHTGSLRTTYLGPRFSTF